MGRERAENGKIEGMNIPSPKRAREKIAKLISQTRYSPEKKIQKDKHGMPVVAPDPADPDDE